MTTNKNKMDDALLARATKLVGEVETLPKLPKELRDGASIDAMVAKLRAQASELVTAHAAYETALAARNATRRELRVLLSRITAGVKAVYGPDSVEYERAGGVRNSKRAKRKPRTPATPATLPKPA